jgi:hypothetical protein
LRNRLAPESWLNPKLAPFAELATYHISLNFQIEERTALEDVRFNAAKLIEATTLCKAYHIVTVTSRSKYHGDWE